MPSRFQRFKSRILSFFLRHRRHHHHHHHHHHTISSPQIQHFQQEFKYDYQVIIDGAEDILYDLFFMRLELDEGEMPVFDPMTTIVPSSYGSEIFHFPPMPSIASDEEEFVPPPPYEFDPMRTIGKYE
jgi:hypothetical protein